MTYSPKTAISLSGTDVGVDTINFALINEDVLHRKVHQGMLFYAAGHQSGNNTEVITFAITSFSGINPHISFQLMGVPPGSFVSLNQHVSGSTLFLGTRMGEGTPNMALGHSGSPTIKNVDVFTSTNVYSSAFVSGGAGSPFLTLIASGQVGIGFGNQASFPLYPHELVLNGGTIYSINITPQANTNVHANIYVHWYESGA